MGHKQTAGIQGSRQRWEKNQALLFELWRSCRIWMGITELGSSSQAGQMRAGKWQLDVKKWKNPRWKPQNSYWGIVPSNKFNLSVDGGS